MKTIIGMNLLVYIYNIYYITKIIHKCISIFQYKLSNISIYYEPSLDTPMCMVASQRNNGEFARTLCCWKKPNDDFADKHTYLYTYIQTSSHTYWRQILRIVAELTKFVSIDNFATMSIGYVVSFVLFAVVCYWKLTYALLKYCDYQLGCIFIASYLDKMG